MFWLIGDVLLRDRMGDGCKPAGTEDIMVQMQREPQPYLGTGNYATETRPMRAAFLDSRENARVG